MTENLQNQKLKDKLNALGNSSKDLINILTPGGPNIYYLFIALIIVGFIIFSVVSWIFYTLNKYSSACKKLDSIYGNNNYGTQSFSTAPFDELEIINVNSEYSKSNDERLSNYFDISKSCLVKNYYVKTAYNACCGGGYKNNFVSLCALKTCIKQGARCLDLEIYSYNNEPIIAASTANNNSIKETYNYLKFDDVFREIIIQGLENSEIGCHLDPMFLHFRIMSSNVKMFTKLNQIINGYRERPEYNQFFINNSYYDDKDDVYGTNYNWNKKGSAMLEAPLRFFSRRLIIIANVKNTELLRSVSFDYIQLLSNSEYCKQYRFNNIFVAGENNDVIIDESREKIQIVLPNLDNSLDNFDSALAFSNGCQFVAMKFQNMDANLFAYHNYFKDAELSFILKEPNRRSDRIIAASYPAGEDMPTAREHCIGIAGECVS